MKIIIIGLTLLVSISNLASASVGEENNLFTAEGVGTSDTLFMAGCSDAKDQAVNDAKTNCEDIYQVCEELETKRTYRRGANPFRDAVLYVIPTGSSTTKGRCEYESTFEGINISK